MKKVNTSNKTSENKLIKSKTLFILTIAFVLLTFYILAIDPIVGIGEIIGRFLYQVLH